MDARVGSDRHVQSLPVPLPYFLSPTPGFTSPCVIQPTPEFVTFRRRVRAPPGFAPLPLPVSPLPPPVSPLPVSPDVSIQVSNLVRFNTYYIDSNIIIPWYIVTHDLKVTFF